MRFVTVALALVLVACSALPAPPTPLPRPTSMPAVPRVVFADRALANVLRDIRTAFKQDHPAARIEFIFADAPELRTNLEAGLRPDLVITEDTATLHSLADKNLLQDAPRVAARESLAVVVARANPAGLERVEDLNRPGLRVVIAAENTSLGQATRALVENFRHDAAFGPEFPDLFFGNVTFQERSGSEVLARVLSGQADVGIVYSSEANLQRDRLKVLPMPEGLNVAAEYSAGMLNTSTDPARAQAFLDFLASPQAKALWRDYGFEPTK